MAAYTVQEFAELAGVTVPVLRRWMSADPRFPDPSGAADTRTWDAGEAKAYVDGLITSDEFAAELGISTATLLVRRSGDTSFPTVAVRRNRAPLWHRSDVLQYRDQGASQSPAAPAAAAIPSEFVSAAQFADILGVQPSALHGYKSNDQRFPKPAIAGGRTSYWWRSDAEKYRQVRNAGAQAVYSRRKIDLVDARGFAERSGLSLASVNMYRLSDPHFPTPAIAGRYPYWWAKDASSYRAQKAQRRAGR